MFFAIDFPPSLAVVCLYSTVPEQAPERQGGRYIWGCALTLCGFSGGAYGGGSGWMACIIAVRGLWLCMGLVGEVASREQTVLWTLRV